MGRRLGWGGYTLKQIRQLGGDNRSSVLATTGPDETAAILFTSGSTGVAKGVVYTHGIFAAQVEMLRRLYAIEAGEVDLPTFPLFGLFGPALGMTSIIPEMDATRPAHVDPRKILDAIRFFGVTNLFGSPALIQRVGRYAAAHGVSLPTLRRVISAGAPVPWQAIQRFAALLADGVQVHTPYGATESLPVCSIGSDEVLRETRLRTAEGAGVCVGCAVQGMTVKIIRINDEPIPEWRDDLELPMGEIGEIVVRGPVVTASYWNRPESTALAKIADPIYGGFYHRMGDLGYVDATGRVWFCGRKSQRVVTRNGPLFTVACEGVFNAHPAVHRTALVGVSHNGEIEPVLCVEREKDAPSLGDEDLRRELLAFGARHPHTRRHSDALVSSELPRGHPPQRQDIPRETRGMGGETSNMIALVTGGGGFLGGAIVRRLRERGDQVHSLSRGHYAELAALGVTQHRGDIADAMAVCRAAAGCDIVFHVAAKAGVGGRYRDYYRTNVTGTANVLAACRHHGITRLVYTSSPSVVFNGRDMAGVDESVPYPSHFEAAYPRTKALAERMVLRANSATLATVSLRPHLIWGPGDNHLIPRLLTRARAGRLRRIGTESKLIDSVYIDNAADAHLLASDRLAPDRRSPVGRTSSLKASRCPCGTSSIAFSTPPDWVPSRARFRRGWPTRLAVCWRSALPCSAGTTSRR